MSIIVLLVLLYTSGESEVAIVSDMPTCAQLATLAMSIRGDPASPKRLKSAGCAIILDGEPT